MGVCGSCGSLLFAIGNHRRQPAGIASDKLSPEERRTVALEAANKRLENQPGISPETAAELRDRQQKEELLGKLTEHYAKKKKDPPNGFESESLSGATEAALGFCPAG